MTLLLTTQAKDIEVDDGDWPRCAKCHMPVEHFWSIDTGTSLIFVARCHGQEQIVEIPDEVLDPETFKNFELGPVFG